MAVMAAPLTPARSPSRHGTMRRSRVASGSERLKIPSRARLIGLGEGFPELVPPEVPRQLIVPAAVVTKDNVDEYEQYAFN